MLSASQERYFKEYEKYKDIKIEPGRYQLKSASHIHFIIESIDVETEKVNLFTEKTGVKAVKTLHWCRKNLLKVS